MRDVFPDWRTAPLTRVSTRTLVGSRSVSIYGPRQGVIRVAELRATAADYDGKLAFVLYALGVSREGDGFFGADDGRGRLEEHQRFFGDFVAEFGGVSGIVAADANDFAGINGR